MVILYHFKINRVGGCSPKKNQKKPVATPKSVNWHWFFLVFFGFFKFPNWHWFFLVFFCFFLALVLARIRNWKLVFFGFFWFFLAFFGFFWHRPWPTFEIGNWFFGLRWFFLVFFGFFWDFLVFFWYLNLGLEYHPKKYQKTPKKPKKPKKTKKTQKKTKKNQSLHQNW